MSPMFKTSANDEGLAAKKAERQQKVATAQENTAAKKADREDRNAATRKVQFLKAEYLGGLPNSKHATGALYIGDEEIGVGAFGPKHGIVKWADVRGVSFDTGTAKKSRAGKALAFGVFALAAKNTQDDAHLTAVLKDGNAALYRVVGKSGSQVRAKIQPFLVAAGVPCLDDGIAAPVAAVSVADELTKLAALKDSGVLSEDEFAVEKAKLLS